MKTSEVKEVINEMRSLMVYSIDNNIDRVGTDRRFKRFLRGIFIVGWLLLLALVWLTIHFYGVNKVGFILMMIYWAISIPYSVIYYWIVGWGRMFRYYKAIWS